jgi:hypothetical protein
VEDTRRASDLNVMAALGRAGLRRNQHEELGFFQALDWGARDERLRAHLLWVTCPEGQFSFSTGLWAERRLKVSFTSGVFYVMGYSGRVAHSDGYSSGAAPRFNRIVCTALTTRPRLLE